MAVTKSSSVAALVVVFSCLFAAALAATDLGSIVVSLQSFQDKTNGGFKLTPGGDTSLQGTADALTLSNLYGYRRFPVDKTGSFIAAHQNSDGGYGAVIGASSTLEATSNAAIALKLLELEVSPVVVSYINSLFDAKVGLFAGFSGDQPNIASTLIALDTLFFLEGKIADELQEAISEGITSRHATGTTKFSDDILTNALTISVAAHTKLALGDSAAFAKTLLDQQTPSVYTNFKVLAEFTRALFSLGPQYAKEANNVALEEALQFVPYNLHSAALANKAAALTGLLNKYTKVNVVLDGANNQNNQIDQGTKFSPRAYIATFGIPNGALTVAVGIAHKSGSKGFNLHFNSTTRQYSTETAFDTTNTLGQLTFTTTYSQFIPGHGRLSDQNTFTRKVGYRLEVIPTAVFQTTGQTIKNGDIVSPGTDFAFNVRLGTAARGFFENGDFVLDFSVRDSANSVIYSQSLDGASNAAPIEFTYSFETYNIPSGYLFFSFDVSESGSGEAHTSSSVYYRLSAPLIATNVKINGLDEVSSLKLGDKVSVSFVPATFPDLRVPIPLSAENAFDRSFTLDIISESGIVLTSVTGEAQANGQYDFDFEVPSTLDFVGFNAFVFRFETHLGSKINLQNYDSTSNELLDDSSLRGFTVDAKLRVKEFVEQPSSTKFFYGSEIALKFIAVDSISSKVVTQGNHAKFSLRILNKDDAGNSFTTVKVAAVQDDSNADVLAINWPVNPNAATGAATLLVSAESVDGNDIALLARDSDDLIQHQIEIIGEITFESSTFSTSTASMLETGFVVEFKLLSLGKTLEGARLKAAVVYNGERLLSSPVAIGPNGRYSVSWTSSHSKAKSGEYRIEFYRESDLQRQQEKLDAIDRDLKNAQREAELNGSSFDDSAFVKAASAIVSTPISSLSFYHNQAVSTVPVNAEWLAFVLLTSGFVWSYYKKVVLSK